MLLDLFSKNKRWFIPLIIVLIVTISVAAYISTLMHRQTFYKGIHVENLPLSGLSRDEAAAAVEKKLGEAFNKKLELVYGDKKWDVGFDDISLKFLVDNALDQAFYTGRSGNIVRRLSEIVNVSLEDINISTKVGYDRELVIGILNEIKKQVDLEEEDASISYESGKIVTSKETVGKSMVIDKNLELVENHIRERKFGKIELVVDDVKPRISFDDIKEIESVIGSFSTIFNPGDANRTYNLGLACSKINGTILLPDDIFSMNKTLGPRTIENGYRDAKIILGDELVNGPGGGVCQVTTTLYDAVLKSRLAVVERRSHSLPSYYVGPGQDATIADDYIDFKFQNSNGYAVYLSAVTEGNALRIKILGKKSDDESIVKLKPEILEEYPPGEDELVVDNNIPDEEKVVAREAKKGCKVILYREIYNNNGELLDREKISVDTYKPIRAQVKVNQAFYDKIKGTIG